MQEMDRRVALLRLLLADIADRERRTKDGATQLRAQLTRIVDFTVQFNSGVANGLSALAEVEERLLREEMTLRHLELLRTRARRELDALVVTRSVADARARLVELEARRTALLSAQPTPPATDASSEAEGAAPSPAAVMPPAELAEIDAEIAELRTAIEAASDAAARALTEGLREM
jgi:hypothetical protein